ncbi:MAG TPA: MFS transporter [Polyangia bacterium]|nr:MFS transporter [Polyangia bacterium]
MYRPRSGNDDDDDPDSRFAGTAARSWTTSDSGDPPLATRAFVDVIMAQLFFGFAYATFVLLPKLLAADYGANARQIGAVMATFGALSLAVSPAIGPIAARLGLRRTLAAGDLVLAASAVGFMFMTHAGLFAALLRGLQGIAWALCFGAGMALCAEVAPPARLGQALGIFGAASLGMNAVAPVVAEPIAARFGPRPVFALAAAAALIGARLCRRLPPDVAPPPTSHAGSSDAMSWSAVRARLPVFTVLCVGALAAASMFTFVAPFALAHGVGVVRGFFVAYTVAALASRFALARFADRTGQRPVALAGGVGYGIAVIAMGVFGPAHLTLVGALFGLAHGIVFPALMTLVLTGVSGAQRPRLLGWANGAMNLGIVGLAPLGSIAGALRYRAVFIATGAVTLTTTAALLAPSAAKMRGSRRDEPPREG